MSTEQISVYVPRAGTAIAKRVLPRSGMVGTITDDMIVTIDYEGNAYGASNMKTYADRVSHAAGRHCKLYPTAARAVVHVEALFWIGYWQVDKRTVEFWDEEGRQALCEYLGIDPADREQLASELQTTELNRR